MSIDLDRLERLLAAAEGGKAHVMVPVHTMPRSLTMPTVADLAAVRLYHEAGNALPALIAELREARAERAEVVAVLREVGKKPPCMFCGARYRLGLDGGPTGVVHTDDCRLASLLAKLDADD